MEKDIHEIAGLPAVCQSDPTVRLGWNLDSPPKAHASTMPEVRVFSEAVS